MSTGRGRALGYNSPDLLFMFSLGVNEWFPKCAGFSVPTTKGVEGDWL